MPKAPIEMIPRSTPGPLLSDALVHQGPLFFLQGSIEDSLSGAGGVPKALVEAFATLLQVSMTFGKGLLPAKRSIC